MKIGVFDSGFGGLSVLHYILSDLPQYSYIYLGDNARAPYGDRSQELIYEFTRQGVEFLFQHDCEIVVLACNTACSAALRRLQQEWLPKHYPDRRILGVIIPVVEKLATFKKGSVVGIIGTRATINSDVYVAECRKRTQNDIRLIQKACPLLVPLIEEGWNKSIIARKTTKKYLNSFKQTQLDALVLACTHYALIAKMIRGIMGRNVRIIEAGPVVAHSLKKYLADHPEQERLLTKESTLTCYSTDPKARVRDLVARFWQKPLEVLSASIEEL